MILHIREHIAPDESVVLVGKEEDKGQRYLVIPIVDSAAVQRVYPELAKKSSFLDFFRSIFWI